MTQLDLMGPARGPHMATVFCGIGGSCEGLFQATGTHPAVAINHWEWALGVHALNHPRTLHLHENVWDARAYQLERGRRLDALWLSPDCTDFSRAKGGQPRSKGRRSLANVLHKWLREGLRPRVIFLENVVEFEGWGPLDRRGKRIPARAGEYFRRWVRGLERRGYEVQWQPLVAADYGAPTTRKRLYLIARCDGRPIIWPTPTHGSPEACAKDPGLKPWRTAAECIDWSIPALSIFASPEEARAWGRANGCGTPRRPLAEATQRRVAAGLKRFVLEAPEPGPFILCLTHGGRLEPGNEPMRTITTANRGERAVIVPYMVQTGYGERRGQAPRVLDLHAPLGTVVAGGAKRAICMAWMAKHYGGVTGHGLERPLGTVTTVDHHSLCAAYAVQGGEEAGAARVAAFLIKYYGQGVGQDLREPLHTVTTKDRMGLVQVQLDGEPWTVVDITIRMLQPRELATAQGFRPDYILRGTKTEQVEGIGNAVSPVVSRALASVNL